jgi:hypothetical protein
VELQAAKAQRRKKKKLAWRRLAPKRQRLSVSRRRQIVSEKYYTKRRKTVTKIAKKDENKNVTHMMLMAKLVECEKNT